MHALRLEVLEHRNLLAALTVTIPSDSSVGAANEAFDSLHNALYGDQAVTSLGSFLETSASDTSKVSGPQSELVSRAQIPSLSAGGSSKDAAVSANGRYVVFVSNATNLVPDMDIVSGLRNVYRHDRLNGQVDLVSVNADGSASGNGESFDPVISADGTVVAFISQASDLHQLDTDSALDVFARNLVTGTTELVSVNADGTASGNFTSNAPAISADGMVVAFASSASDLHPLDTDTSRDVLARNLVTGTTELASVNTAGTASGNDDSFTPVISADGAVVAFRSRASDLHPLDTDTDSDVFARSLVTGTTELASVNTAGTASGNDDSYDPVISADGAVVAFWSRASDLHPLDTDTGSDVFARNLVTGTTELVSVNADGTASGNFISFRPVISADGTVVAFQSQASDLHPLDTDVSWDILARNLVTRTTDLVSVNADGTASGNSSSVLPVINADGTVVAFESQASDLHQLDTDSALDVFARSLVTGVTQLVSANATGTASGNDDSYAPVISADGTVVAFESPASDLVGGDLNGFLDVFRWQLGTAATSIVSAATPTQMSRPTSANGLSEDATVSADGRYVVFVSEAVNLAPGMDILPGLQNVYRHDRLTGQVDLVSVNAAGTASGNGDSFDPAISADGTIVAFESSASDLHPLDNDTRRDILARSLVTGTTELVSVNATGTASGNGDSYDPVISADGAVVAFWSRASDLHQLDTDTISDVFARSRVTGTTELVSLNAAGTASGNSSSVLPVINADGTVVAFQSQAADLNPLDADNDSDVFARILVNGTTELMSVNAAGTASGIGHSFDPVISADGMVVAFQSRASDLHPLDTDTISDVFARSLVTGTTELVSLNAAGIASGNGISFAPVISTDGKVVAFQSQATDLHPLDTDTMSDVFARSLVAGTTELVSLNAAGTASGNFDSRAPVISADGTVVAFLSFASDLHPLDTDSGVFSGDIFSRSLVQGTTALVSVNTAGTASGNFTSRAPAISADGMVVAFESGASDLVEQDLNYNQDVFSFGLYDQIVVDNADDVVDANYSPGELSVREAIALANAASGVQRITFDSTLDGAEIDLAFGFLAIEDAVIIDASALKKGFTIDAQLTSRTFQVGPAADYVLMDGLTLKRGQTTGTDESGGAIRSLMSGPLVIRNSVIHDSETLGNDAHGGAVFTIGDLYLQNSLIENNSTQGTGGMGGAVFSLADATVTDSTLSGNSTSGGMSEGGALFVLGDLTIQDSTVSGNSTSGVAARGGAASVRGQLTLYQSTVSGNSTAQVNAHGGGFAFFNQARIAHSTLTNNHTYDAGASGGALFQELSNTQSISISSSIVAGNSSADGPDLRSLPGNVQINYSLIGNNSNSGLAEAPLGAPDADGNLIGQPISSGGSGVINAQLGPLANNGGTTKTHALLAISPAINAGDPLALAGSGFPVLDQRRAPFLRISQSRIDMGALERQAPGCDFNGDQRCDLADIDALVAEIAAGTYQSALDLNGDGAIDLLDRDAWLAEAGALHLPSGNPYRLGDANLDAQVNETDFRIWNENKFTVTAAWSLADFNADGFTDGQDLLIWNANKFTSPVPVVRNADQPIEDDPRHEGPWRWIDLLFELK